MTKPKRRPMVSIPPTNVPIINLEELSYEQLDSLLEEDYNAKYQQYLLELEAWNEKESKKDWLDKVEPYVDGFNFITSQIGKGLESTVVGAPLGAIIETIGDIPGVILDGGQFVRDFHRSVRDPSPENRANLNSDVLDLTSSIYDTYDPTGLGKDIYLGGKYGYLSLTSDKPTYPMREDTRRLYNMMHGLVEQDNTRVARPINLDTLSYEQLDSLLEENFNRRYQQYTRAARPINLQGIPPMREDTRRLYNMMHGLVEQDNTRVARPRIMLQRIPPKNK